MLKVLLLASMLDLTGTVVAIKPHVQYKQCDEIGVTFVLFDDIPNLFTIMCGTKYKIGEEIVFKHQVEI